MQASGEHTQAPSVLPKRPTGLILLIFLAFIALGMPDGLSGVGWPSVRADFGVPLDALGQRLMATIVGYLISSSLSGALMRRWGVARLLIVSCLITGAALIGFTIVPDWWMMVALGVVTGLGAGAIDAGLNVYVARHFGAGLMQWLHASYGVGITAGPFIMTMALTRFDSWRLGYQIVGGFQFLMAACFVFTLPMWKEKPGGSTQADQSEQAPSLPLRDSLREVRVWWNMLLFFFYVASEMTLGAWVYTLLTEGRGVDPGLAGLVTGSFWLSFTLGRILAGLFSSKFKMEKLVRACMVLALGGGLLLWANLSTWLNLGAVALIGLAFAPIYPGMVTGAAARVGKTHVDNAIGLQSAAGGLGGTLLTSLVGVLARNFGLEVVPMVLVIFIACVLGIYLFIDKKYVRHSA